MFNSTVPNIFAVVCCVMAQIKRPNSHDEQTETSNNQLIRYVSAYLLPTQTSRFTLLKHLFHSTHFDSLRSKLALRAGSPHIVLHNRKLFLKCSVQAVSSWLFCLVLNCMIKQLAAQNFSLQSPQHLQIENPQKTELLKPVTHKM